PLPPKGRAVSLSGRSVRHAGKARQVTDRAVPDCCLTRRRLSPSPVQGGGCGPGGWPHPQQPVSPPTGEAMIPRTALGESKLPRPPGRLLLQPHGFEGFLRIWVADDASDLPVADRPDPSALALKLRGACAASPKDAEDRHH